MPSNPEAPGGPRWPGAVFHAIPGLGPSDAPRDESQTGTHAQETGINRSHNPHGEAAKTTRIELFS
jgi:hypothetical protein